MCSHLPSNAVSCRVFIINSRNLPLLFLHSLLKKSIKRLEQRKKSTKKKWAAREESVDKRKAAAQHKRTENIKRRKDDVKKVKAKKAAKKGRVKVPGFK